MSVENREGRGSVHFPAADYSSIESLLRVMRTNTTFKKLASITAYQSRILLKLKEGVKRLVFSSSLQRIFSLEGIEIKGFTESFEYCNINACIPTQMYVYTDLIYPQHVGDVLAPLLRIINVDNRQYVSGSNVVKVFTHPHYVPVLKREFQQVEIDIRDDSGFYVPFTKGKLSVSLHFRKIRENK